MQKIKLNRDFRRIYGRGKSYVTPFFVVYCMKNKHEDIRLGITAGKKIGGAVERNRAKRVISAAFRQCLANIHPGHDFIIVARTRILKIKSTLAAEVLEKQLKSAGVWCLQDDQ